MVWVAKVNRHCAYHQRKTVTNPLGVVCTNYVKRRPAIITGFATDTAPRLRVRHYTSPSTETYGTAAVGVPRMTDPIAVVTTNPRNGKYVSF